MAIQHLLFYVFMLFLIPNVSEGNRILAGKRTLTSRCMENERKALIRFKESLIDDFGLFSSWGGEEAKTDCCNWRGVKCSSVTGHVVALNLRNPVFLTLSPELDRPLRGKINPSLAELTYLTYLDLSGNDFQLSHIPKFIGSLSRLQYLNLEGSKFFGTIPDEIGNLTNLRTLYMGGDYNRKLSVSNLNWLSNLRSLEVLSLLFVDLSEMEWLQSIAMLPLLSELHLDYCNLHGVVSPSLLPTNLSSIPLTKIELIGNNLISSSVYNWLFNFSRTLVEIDISVNPLGGSISDAFGNMMSSLQILRLSHCSLEGVVPKIFRNLTRLQNLELFVNNITGELPEIFQTLNASMASLEILYLSENKIYGSLPDFTEFSSLKELWLDDNQLDGSFPNIFRQTSALELLSISQNELHGSIPDLRVFPLLESLYLTNNKLKGRVPESIGQLSNLKELFLGFNSLALEFTVDRLPLFNLEFISLANCELGPHFPKWLVSQNNFVFLDISSAEIYDSVPQWLWDLSPRLEYLNISNNHIYGLVPDLSLKFVNFPEIDLSVNRLRGPIPLLPPNISTLNLSKNNLFGSIIPLCSSLKFLNSLDLSNNQFSGEIPECWTDADNLEILNLSYNNFTKYIPHSFGFLNQLQLMSLSNNWFMGELPSSLKRCTHLEVIDISENNLSGKVPAWIGTHLTSLSVIILRRNGMSGTIPHSFCNLNRTNVLDLSQNIISGSIPKCFNKLYSLTQTTNPNSSVSLQLSSYYIQEYVASVLLQWKGKVSEYKNILGQLKCIDLSGNKLVGNIPEELTSLEGVVSLNLSRNNLTGSIMQNISRMKMLEVIDLSQNHLSGQLPLGLARLNFLSVLNLSDNNFWGKIPLSTQLQSFDASSFAGNPKLCGLPLSKCPGEVELPTSNTVTSHEEQGTDEDKLVTIGFYISAVLGFVVVFWGFVGPLFLLTSWRYTYYMFLDKLQDWVLVTMEVHMARLRRKFNG